MRKYIEKNLILYFVDFNNRNYGLAESIKGFCVYSEILGITHQIENIQNDFNIDEIKKEMINHFMRDEIFHKRYKVIQRNEKIENLLK